MPLASYSWNTELLSSASNKVGDHYSDPRCSTGDICAHVSPASWHVPCIAGTMRNLALILGMHRSGTSLMAHSAEAAGYSLGERAR